MKTKVLNPEKAKPTEYISSGNTEVDESFERDWGNGITGKEMVKSVQDQIKEWWRANREISKS